MIQESQNGERDAEVVALVHVDEQVMCVLVSLICRSRQPLRCGFDIALYMPALQVQLAEEILRPLVVLVRGSCQQLHRAIRVHRDAITREVQLGEAVVMDNLSKLKLLLQDQNRYIPLDPLLGMFRDRVYGTGQIERSAKNDIKLDAVFGTLLICVPNYDGQRNEVNAVAAAMIRSLFPEEVGADQ